MTENGDSLDNVISVCVNGILKEEYLNNYDVENYSQAKELLDAVSRIYNNERNKKRIGYITPEKVHSKELKKGDCNWKKKKKKKEIVNQF